MAHSTTSNNGLPCHVGLHTANVVSSKHCDQSIIRRRSMGFRTSDDWGYHFIKSLSNEYVGEAYTVRMAELKGEVKLMIERGNNVLDQLEVVETLQRLGVAYHFEAEIERALNRIYLDNFKYVELHQDNLYATSLQFRLLRQQGYDVSQDIFHSFKDDQGNFKACLCDDMKGLIYLYEASYLLLEGEDILEEAQEFAKINLLVNVNKQGQYDMCDDNHRYLSMMASHALELPLHWRMQRAEARWFVDAYQRCPQFNPLLLDFAKLDFNMAQAGHQEDLKHVMNWWEKMGLAEKLNFARARPVEGYFWILGWMFEPEIDYFRRMLSRVGLLIVVVDDIYDVYGTLEELHQFTEAIVRWDINAVDGLPYYMKLCFLAIYNSMNEMAFDLLKNQGVDTTLHLKKTWADLCKSYFLEAKWYHSGYTPTFEEYLANGWISSAAPMLIVHGYLTTTNQISLETSECLGEYPDIVRFSSLILRLANDLGTSSDEMKRGDTLKAIQCYMCETGVSEEAARKHIWHLISEAWKKMNKCNIRNPQFSQTVMRMIISHARISQFMYLHGDGFGAHTEETKNQMVALLVQPVPISNKE